MGNRVVVADTNQGRIAAPAEVVAFWLAGGKAKWFTKDAAFDAEVRSRFEPTYAAARAGGLADWEETADGALALLIVLDQFPRNLFRGDARVFETDTRARAVANRAIARGFDQSGPGELQRFFYIPFMHSEVLADQERCIALNRAAGDLDSVQWAEHHADIIRRFGRFPHRNALLGRASTDEERAFLDAGGFTG